MKRHFSMLREFHLADWFTLGNAFCGTGAVFASLRFLQDGQISYLLLGMALIPLAFILDALDGRIARWRKTHSTLGRELDSLADVISFGVAPAALAYACGMQGGWDWLVLSFFVCCGVSRLARYNVTAETLAGEDDKVPYFEGTPIPAAGGGAGRCRLARSAGPAAVGRQLADGPVAAAPSGADVCRVRQFDDQ